MEQRDQFQQANLPLKSPPVLSTCKVQSDKDINEISKLSGKRMSPESDDNKTTGRWKKWEHQRFLEGITFLEL